MLYEAFLVISQNIINFIYLLYVQNLEEMAMTMKFIRYNTAELACGF